MDRKKGQTLSYSCQPLQSYTFSPQQWQFVPGAVTDSSLVCPTLPEVVSSYLPRFSRTNQPAAPPGRSGSQLHGVSPSSSETKTSAQQRPASPFHWVHPQMSKFSYSSVLFVFPTPQAVAPSCNKHLYVNLRVLFLPL